MKEERHSCGQVSVTHLQFRPDRGKAVSLSPGVEGDRLGWHHEDQDEMNSFQRLVR
jgi:hypothetical protein